MWHSQQRDMAGSGVGAGLVSHGGRLAVRVGKEGLEGDLPSIRVLGNKGASAMSKPPKPQPTSANSGVFEEAAKAG